jgi:RNA polymerase sigma-70 factor
MSRLAENYRAVLSASNAGMPNCNTLEVTIERLYARGRARHPDLFVDDLAFAAHLARCRTPLVRDPTHIHAEDLLLVCAALAGATGAVTKLRTECWPTVIGYTRHICPEVSSLDDLEQSLWAALLVGEPARPPRLTTYAGVGELAGFVGITAQRMALRRLRRDELAVRAAVRANAEAAIIAGDVELDLMKRRYLEHLQVAARAALDVLGDRERMILRLRCVDGLTIARIAKAYRVGQATVSRWLDKARADVRSETRRLLRERLPLTESDFEALVSLMASSLDLSISSVLRATG